jgi:PIN domain nuclease of toxin-antitoxin system
MTSNEVHLDTQVIVWLYADPQRAWPAPARQLLSTGNLRYSPMVRLELRYLYEIGRIKVAPEELLAELAEKLDLAECELPFGRVIDQAEPIAWTRDPFDRLIVAYAALAQASLVTADHLIREKFPAAVWATGDSP